MIGADGVVEAVAGTTRDVTERQSMDAALRASEEFNRTILENSPDCVKILDIHGRLERMNLPGLCLMEIDDFNAFHGREWPTLWPEEAQAEVAAAAAAGPHGEPGRFERLCPAARGTQK